MWWYFWHLYCQTHQPSLLTILQNESKFSFNFFLFGTSKYSKYTNQFKIKYKTTKRLSKYTLVNQRHLLIYSNDEPLSIADELCVDLNWAHFSKWLEVMGWWFIVCVYDVRQLPLRGCPLLWLNIWKIFICPDQSLSRVSHTTFFGDTFGTCRMYGNVAFHFQCF